MEKIIGTVLSLVFVGFLSVESNAQWPLGKDLPQPPGKSAETGISVTGSGRHQIFISPNVKGHTFMIDTDTGKIWIFKKDNTSGDYSLQRIPVEQDAASGKK